MFPHARMSWITVLTFVFSCALFQALAASKCDQLKVTDFGDAELTEGCRLWVDVVPNFLPRDLLVHTTTHSGSVLVTEITDPRVIIKVGLDHTICTWAGSLEEYREQETSNFTAALFSKIFFVITYDHLVFYIQDGPFLKRADTQRDSVVHVAGNGQSPTTHTELLQSLGPALNCSLGGTFQGVVDSTGDVYFLLRIQRQRTPNRGDDRLVVILRYDNANEVVSLAVPFYQGAGAIPPSASYGNAISILLPPNSIAAPGDLVIQHRCPHHPSRPEFAECGSLGSSGMLLYTKATTSLSKYDDSLISPVIPDPFAYTGGMAQSQNKSVVFYFAEFEGLSPISTRHQVYSVNFGMGFGGQQVGIGNVRTGLWNAPDWADIFRFTNVRGMCFTSDDRQLWMAHQWDRHGVQYASLLVRLQWRDSSTRPLPLFVTPPSDPLPRCPADLTVPPTSTVADTTLVATQSQPSTLSTTGAAATPHVATTHQTQQVFTPEPPPLTTGNTDTPLQETTSAQSTTQPQDTPSQTQTSIEASVTGGRDAEVTSQPVTQAQATPAPSPAPTTGSVADGLGTPSSTNDEAGGALGPSSTGVVVGVAVGTLVFIVAVVVAGVLLRRKRRLHPPVPPPKRLFENAPGGGKADATLSFSDCVTKLCSFGQPVMGFPNVNVPGGADCRVILDDIDSAYANLANKCPGYKKYPEEGAAMVARLTPCEAKAIMAYTHPGLLYSYLNASLMAERRANGIVEHIGPYFALLYRGLEKLERVCVTAHRGVRVREIKALKDTFNNPSKLPPGRELHFWGFSSFSLSDKVATDPYFFGNAGQQGIVYSCGKLVAVNVAPLSMVGSDEEEVLPLPPLCIKVQTALKPTPNKLVIAVEQLDSEKDSYVVPRTEGSNPP